MPTTKHFVSFPSAQRLLEGALAIRQPDCPADGLLAVAELGERVGIVSRSYQGFAGEHRRLMAGDVCSGGDIYLSRQAWDEVLYWLRREVVPVVVEVEVAVLRLVPA